MAAQFPGRRPFWPPQPVSLLIRSWSAAFAGAGMTTCSVGAVSLCGALAIVRSIYNKVFLLLAVNQPKRLMTVYAAVAKLGISFFLPLWYNA